MNAAKDCTLQEKLLRCAMALILAAGALLASVAASPAYAAPSTVDVSIGGKIPYGGFATTWMSADGNIAYCAEPSSPTPAPGSYSTSPVPSGDVTAAIWYSFGSPGFDASMFPGSWYDGGGWDDANDEYRNFFGDHKPARIIVSTQELHFGCLVEIEAVAECAQKGAES